TSRFSRPVPAIPPSPAFSPLHPFPTRRSSDLAARASRDSSTATARRRPHPSARGAPSSPTADRGTAVRTPPRPAGHIGRSSYTRSEEHTSELQSRENLVCRLLLEKKNKPIEHM